MSTCGKSPFAAAVIAALAFAALAGDDGLVRSGAVSPYGEVSPFVFGGKLRRLELVDDSRGLAAGDPSIHAQIRDVATGEVLSCFGGNCYYYSAFVDGGRVYVTATERNVEAGEFCGSRIRLFGSDDLVHWEERVLVERPGWKFFNTTLTKGPDGYLLALETNTPKEWVPFTLVFATSKDLAGWEFLGDEYAYPKDRYCGGPFLFWREGFYYLSLVTSERGGYTTTIWRSRDLKSWEGAAANPILTWEDPGERNIAPHAAGIDDGLAAQIRDRKICSASDLEFCEFEGCVRLNYIIGDQAGFYYTVESGFRGTLDELLAHWFPGKSRLISGEEK